MISLNKVQQFQIACLEGYKIFKKKSGKKALNDFQTYGVFEFIETGYEVLHTQSIDYVVAEIDDFIKHRK
ncbi:MAG: hypothetical protein H6Q20_1542 [Bacteroidetes bacterium]|nr:hypothetical protein [Bacteroidota bacterium]